MKKPTLDASSVTGPLSGLMASVVEILLLITGQAGSPYQRTKGIRVPYPSTGIDVATGAGTMVTTKAEFDLLLQKVANMETVLNGVIDRLNTP